MEKYKLYDGKIILCFNDSRHIYYVGDKVVYGVTSIVGVLDKPALMYWAVNMAIEYLDNNLKAGESLDEVQIKTLLDNAKKAHRVKKDKSADIGTMIHNWIERYVKSRIEKRPAPERPINEEMNNAIDGFFKWAKDNKVQLIDSEQKIYSKKHHYAGTYDLEAMVNGKRTIIDFKTGKAIYPEMFLQASAYLEAKEEETKNKYDGGVAILRLSQVYEDIEQFEVQQIDYKESKELAKVFLSCLEIYKWKQEVKKQQYDSAKKVNGVKVGSKKIKSKNKK